MLPISFPRVIKGIFKLVSDKEIQLLIISFWERAPLLSYCSFTLFLPQIEIHFFFHFYRFSIELLKAKFHN